MNIYLRGPFISWLDFRTSDQNQIANSHTTTADVNAMMSNPSSPKKKLTKNTVVETAKSVNTIAAVSNTM
jgi:hypothetical protein